MARKLNWSRQQGRGGATPVAALSTNEMLWLAAQNPFRWKRRPTIANAQGIYLFNKSEAGKRSYAARKSGPLDWVRPDGRNAATEQNGTKKEERAKRLGPVYG